MIPTPKRDNNLTRFYYAVMIFVGIVTVCYLSWDHFSAKVAAYPPIISSGNQPAVGNVVQGNNPSGGQNFIGNSGPITVNPAQITARSEKEANRQRMQASGIVDDEDRYFSALQNHELDVLKMFNEVGRTLNPSDFKVFVFGLYDSDVAKVLMMVDQSSGCPTDPGAGNFYTQVDEPALEFVKRVCSKDSVRTKLKQQIGREQRLAEGAQEADHENESNRQRQIASCEQTMLRVFGSRFNQETAHQHCVMQIIPTPSQQPSVVHEASSLERALAILGGDH